MEEPPIPPGYTPLGNGLLRSPDGSLARYADRSRKVIVCGSGRFWAHEVVYAMLDRARPKFDVVMVANGPGVSTLTRQWAAKREVPCRIYTAEWVVHGERAGPICNQQLVEVYGVIGCIAFPGGRGTEDIVTRAKMRGVPIWRPIPPDLHHRA